MVVMAEPDAAGGPVTTGASGSWWSVADLRVYD
jgi:hypothetical protein